MVGRFSHDKRLELNAAQPQPERERHALPKIEHDLPLLLVLGILQRPGLVERLVVVELTCPERT